jgi:hypothetical protein
MAAPRAGSSLQGKVLDTYPCDGYRTVMPEHRPRRFRLRSRDKAGSGVSPLDVRAVDDLRFIRQTMERSAAFTAVPGWGMVAVGVSAFPAAWLAARHAFDLRWLQIWIGDAFLAAGLAIVAIQSKAARAGLPWTSGPGRKVALNFAPPLAAAALLTVPLFGAGLGSVLPGTWMLLYGAGVIAGGAFSVPIVPVMGVCFMVAGAGALLVPALANWFMAAAFGGLHILFGLWIARRYGG